MLSCSRDAITRRMFVIGTVLLTNTAPAAGTGAGRAAGACALLAAVCAAAGRAGAAVPPAIAFSTSRRMIRPPGPDPLIPPRSTPPTSAIFFASGDANTRPPGVGAAACPFAAPPPVRGFTSVRSIVVVPPPPDAGLPADAPSAFFAAA